MTAYISYLVTQTSTKKYATFAKVLDIAKERHYV